MTFSDINGMQARGWTKTDTSEVQSQRLAQANVDVEKLISKVKSLFSAYVRILHGHKNDNAYRNVIDLVMLRVRAELKHIQLSRSSSLDKDQLTADAILQMNAALDGLLPDYAHLTIQQAADEVVNAVRASVNQMNAQVADVSHTAVSYDNEEHATAYDVENDNNDNNIDQDDIPHHENAKSTADAYTEVRVAISTQFNKLNDLFAEKKSLRLIRRIYRRPAIKKTSVWVRIHKNAGKAFDKLQQFTQSTKNAVERQDDKNANAIPTYVKKSSIYKHNGEIFDRMTGRSATFAFWTIKRIQQHQHVIVNAVCTFSDEMSDNVKHSMKMLHDIEKFLPKSLLEKIFDYFKDNAIKKIFTPIRDKLYSILKKKAPKWLKSAYGHVYDVVGMIIKPYRDKVNAVMMLIDNRIGKRGRRQLKRWHNRVKKIKTAIVALFNGIKRVIYMTYRFLKNVLSGVWHGLRAAFRWAHNISPWIRDTFQNSWIGKKVHDMNSAAKAKIGRVTQKVRQFGQKVLTPINTARKAIVGKFSGVGSALSKANTIKNSKIGKAVGGVTRAVGKVVGGIKKLGIGKLQKVFGVIMKAKVFFRKIKVFLRFGRAKLFKLLKGKIFKFLGKRISKYLATMLIGTTIAGPIGPLITAAMFIWDCFDWFFMFQDMMKWFDEHPDGWNEIKTMCVEWAKKALDFTKQIFEAGKKLFRFMYIDGPKMLLKGIARYYNFLTNPFAAISKMSKNSAYVKELDKIKDDNLFNLNNMDIDEKAKFIEKNTKPTIQQIEKLRPDAEKLTERIDKEQNSWWPDNKLICKLLDERQAIYRKMMDHASKIGLQSFSSEVCKDAYDVIDAHEKKMKRMQELKQRFESMRLKYANKTFDIDELEKMCKQQQDKENALLDEIEKFGDDVEQRVKDIMPELEDLYKEEPEDFEEDFVIAS